MAFVVNDGKKIIIPSNVDLIDIEVIEPKYRDIFQYPYFNKVQSMIFQDVLQTDKSLVVSAPTGSGKTVILELAIIRLLSVLEKINYKGDFKIIYMAPVKALCTERLVDWYGKFTQLGLPCIEVTGDTDFLDISSLKNYRIIMTTPEKWDSLTRRWKDHEMIVQMVKLFLIDEVHLLKEEVRGPVLEAVVSRMKTIQESLSVSLRCKSARCNDEESTSALSLNIRFIAISATISNANDIAEWLGTKQQPASAYIIGEEFRPVKLTKIVEGFPCKDGLGLFKFDMGLSYKLRSIIERYCDGKPTLIFCNTRKSVEMTADILSRELMFQFTNDQRDAFNIASTNITDKKLQTLLRSGIGCHHAGFMQQDRNIIEEIFRQGDLPILITTSTLAMGVNLPAHLVIIKTTQYYKNGAYQDYEDSTILQMMGRAGRPQFDNEGVAVIMTKNQDKDRYKKLVGGQRAIESSLHRYLSEHLNAEVALGTLPDLLQAMGWIRSTFLYVRAVKNPSYYGFNIHSDRNNIEKRLEELCLKCMNALARAGMLVMDSNTCVESTEAGRVMAANCLDFETMKLIMKIKGSESLSALIEVLSNCHEFSDLPLRAGEKRFLNQLNRKPRGQEGGTVRFPQTGKIQSKNMKINCLIQAMFDCLPISDPSLHQEILKISRMGEHISKCMMKYLTRSSYIINKPSVYKALLNSVILSKCFVVKLWEDSPYFVKQFTGIGPAYASLLASSGKTSLQSILNSNPRDLERIINKQPPAGNLLKRQASLLPIYNTQILFKQGRTLSITLSLVNSDELITNGSTAGDNHRVSFIVGDSENNLLFYENLADSTLLQRPKQINIIPKIQEKHTLFIHCISHTWVGIDFNQSVDIKQSLNSTLGPLQKNIMNYIQKTKINQSNKLKNNNRENVILSPTTQNSFLTNAFDEKNDKPDQNKMRKNLKNKECLPKKSVKKCDGNVARINNLLKTISEPSTLNTLSPNVNYYKRLPRQLYHAKDNSMQSPPSATDAHQDYLKTLPSNSNEDVPKFIKNYYCKQNSDESFDNWVENFDKSNFNEIANVCENNINSLIAEKANQNLCSVSTPSHTTQNKLDYVVTSQNALLHDEPFRIHEEFDTFVLNEHCQSSTRIVEDTNMIDGKHNVVEGIESPYKQSHSYKSCLERNSSQNYDEKSSLSPKKKSIDSYFKQTKKFKSPPSKKRKLNVQFKSPSKVENYVWKYPEEKFENDCIELKNADDDFDKEKNKTTKSVETNTEPQNLQFEFQSRKVSRLSQTQSTDSEVFKTDSSTQCNTNESTVNTGADFEINVDLNINHIYNQTFIQNLPGSYLSNKVNEQVYVDNADVSMHKKSVSQRNDHLQVFDICNDQGDFTLRTTLHQDNSEIYEDLQKKAIVKIREKMRKICEVQNIPLDAKRKFLNAIQSISNLSSQEFRNLYSIKNLTAIQEDRSLPSLYNSESNAEVHHNALAQNNEHGLRNNAITSSQDNHHAMVKNKLKKNEDSNENLMKYNVVEIISNDDFKFNEIEINNQKQTGDELQKSLKDKKTVQIQKPHHLNNNCSPYILNENQIFETQPGSNDDCSRNPEIINFVQNLEMTKLSSQCNPFIANTFDKASQHTLNQNKSFRTQPACNENRFGYSKIQNLTKNYGITNSLIDNGLLAPNDTDSQCTLNQKISFEAQHGRNNFVDPKTQNFAQTDKSNSLNESGPFVSSVFNTTSELVKINSSNNEHATKSSSLNQALCPNNKINENITSILQKYATLSKSSSSKIDFNTERRNKTDHQKSESPKWIDRTQNKPSICHFLNDANTEDVTKFYKEGPSHRRLETSTGKSYLFDNFQNQNLNTALPTFEENIEENNMYDICDFQREYNEFSDVNIAEDGILDPQEILSLDYSDNNFQETDLLQSKKEIILFDNVSEDEDQISKNSYLHNINSMQYQDTKEIDVNCVNMQNSSRYNQNIYTGSDVFAPFKKQQMMNTLKQYNFTKKTYFNH